MYAGVPMMMCESVSARFGMDSSPCTFESPKSSTLAPGASRRSMTLLGLMSRWMTPMSWAAASAPATTCPIVATAPIDGPVRKPPSIALEDLGVPSPPVEASLVVREWTGPHDSMETPPLSTSTGARMSSERPGIDGIAGDRGDQRRW
jgi:hypothetical protein